MQRRDFLKTTLATAASAMVSESLLAADSTSPSVTVRPVASDRFALEFKPESARPFRILQLTDTHFGSPGKNAQASDARSFEMIRKLVAQEQPDLVMHTGDFINNDQGKRVSFEATEFMDSLGVPWSHALGNHDIGAVSTEDFRARLKNAAFGYFDDQGKRHYAYRLDVMGAGTDQPGWSLFVFDSGFRMPQKHVSPAQLAWFKRQLESDLQQHAKCPALAMIHIPVVEFEKLRAAEQFHGIFGETVCSESDSGQTFGTFRDAQRVKAIFSGHDHANDYCGRLDGIELVYGRVSGWSGYGDLERGGRLIEITAGEANYSHRLVFPRA